MTTVLGTNDFGHYVRLRDEMIDVWSVAVCGQKNGLSAKRPFFQTTPSLPTPGWLEPDV
jgi:hypothetical protein